MRWPWRRAIVDRCLPGKRPLLVRYFLIRTPWFGLYLHHLMRSDNGRDPHDHPWWFVTVLLSGGYFEHTPTGRHWRRRGSVLYRPATWLHWLELPAPVWTLVLRGPDGRAWGFLTPAGWVGHAKYREDC